MDTYANFSVGNSLSMDLVRGIYILKPLIICVFCLLPTFCPSPVCASLILDVYEIQKHCIFHNNKYLL